MFTSASIGHTSQPYSLSHPVRLDGPDEVRSPHRDFVTTAQNQDALRPDQPILAISPEAIVTTGVGRAQSRGTGHAFASTDQECAELVPNETTARVKSRDWHAVPMQDISDTGSISPRSEPTVVVEQFSMLPGATAEWQKGKDAMGTTSIPPTPAFKAESDGVKGERSSQAEFEPLEAMVFARPARPGGPSKPQRDGFIAEHDGRTDGRADNGSSMTTSGNPSFKRKSAVGGRLRRRSQGGDVNPAAPNDYAGPRASTSLLDRSSIVIQNYLPKMDGMVKSLGKSILGEVKLEEILNGETCSPIS